MTSKDIIDKTFALLDETYEYKQLLLAKVDNKKVKESIKRFEERANKEPRKSKRLKHNQEQPIQVLSSIDKLFYERLEGSLGNNLLKHSAVVIPNNRKNKYIHYSSDISTNSEMSFINNIPKDIIKTVISSLLSIELINFIDYNLECASYIKEANSNLNIKKIIKSINDFTPTDTIEENAEFLSFCSLKTHERKSFVFHEDRIKLYSEEDYIINSGLIFSKLSLVQIKISLYIGKK
ncbi:hypothetical protein MFLAVUS_008377 [Mucor flavus]|uniref:F-box domain-containing protein n=1 Tax=Mucor flavus TaxID=439312 RepID=A0ABP9Z724_9FUNG